MKTVKVTDGHYTLNGQEVKVIATGLGGKLDTSIEMNGATHLVSHQALTEPTVQELNVPVICATGVSCPYTETGMSCDPTAHPCAECIYHHLATL